MKPKLVQWGTGSLGTLAVVSTVAESNGRGERALPCVIGLRLTWPMTTWRIFIA